MSDQGGPWGREAPRAVPAPAPAPRRWGLWAILILALVGLVAAMARAFPEAVRGRDDWADVAYGVGFFALACAGLLRVGRGTLSQHLRNAAIWSAVFAVLALGYAYRQEIAEAPQRLRMAFGVGSPIATGDHEMVIPQDDGGGFVVIGLVNGQRVRFLVDTGATDTVLSPDDARRLGVDVDALRYELEAETANGLGYGAPYAARSLEVGAIRIDNFHMTINKAPLSSSLLGQSFLKRLDSFEVQRGKLILRWRDGVGGKP